MGRRRGDWWKWKIDPYTVDAVLIYAQPGSGKRASLLTDYTFGVWDQGELVPIAKAYSGLSNDEIAELDRWIRRHTHDSHGPVRVVEPVHVDFAGVTMLIALVSTAISLVCGMFAGYALARLKFRGSEFLGTAITEVGQVRMVALDLGGDLLHAVFETGAVGLRRLQRMRRRVRDHRRLSRAARGQGKPCRDAAKPLPRIGRMTWTSM